MPRVSVIVEAIKRSGLAFPGDREHDLQFREEIPNSGQKTVQILESGQTKDSIGRLLKNNKSL